MEFKNISSFLEKFKTLAISRDEIQNKITSAIFNETNIQIPPKSIHIDRQTVFIDHSPAAKSIIFTKKREILEELDKTLGKKAPQNIQ